jgi:hypothetical protein
MGLDLKSIVQSPGRLVLFFLLLLTVRGLPTLLIYRSTLPMKDRLELTFLAATALPLLVALSEIGLANGSMLPENAAALVGAGVLSVLVFPAIATSMHRRSVRGKDARRAVRPTAAPQTQAAQTAQPDDTVRPHTDHPPGPQRQRAGHPWLTQANHQAGTPDDEDHRDDQPRVLPAHEEGNSPA